MSDTIPNSSHGAIELRGHGWRVIVPSVLLAGLVSALCTRIVGTPKTEADDRTASKLDVLVAAQAKTDAKLDALIDRVNRSDDARQNAELIQAQRLLEQLRKTPPTP